MAKSSNSTQISHALSAWKAGKLVALPTETVYGLGAPVDNEELISKIFSVKERPFFDPLIVHISSIEMAKKYCSHWNDTLDILARAFWPGPLTLVVQKSSLISSLITSGLDTVGLRMPRSELTLKIIEQKAVGIAAPSANKFTKTSPTQASHVSSQFSQDDVYVVEDIPSEVGIESTIISVNESERIVTILRPGMITSADLIEVLGNEFQIEKGLTAFEKSPEKVESPGQFKAHYRPDYPLSFLDCSSDKKDQLKHSYPDCEFISLSLDPFVTARELYTQMRTPLSTNDLGQAIYKRKCFLIDLSSRQLTDKESELWSSIINRLTKATTFTLEDS